MRIKETKVYTFDELDESAKDKARDWFREGALDYEWWDFVLSDFETIANMLGFEIGMRGREKRIRFSGFCSQGDGACFEGIFRASNFQKDKLKEYAPTDERLQSLAGQLQEFCLEHPTFYANLEHHGNYNHEQTIRFTCEEYKETEEIEEDVCTIETQDEFEELARDLMRWLYRQLETEHEYRLSDEAIDEDITANQYEFTKEGKRA